MLLVDMSRSMLLRGCFLAAKKVAVALDTLIRTQFPHDDLTVIGFAYYARELRPEALAELTWHGYEYGTNLQHGLMLARRILARQRGGNRQIVVITDGEPTAHFENGQVEFSYPPTRRTIQETLREVQRCTRDGITINTFMLERSRALAEFVALVTRLNRGRAFYATPEHLGEYVLVDFVSGRTRGVGLGRAALGRRPRRIGVTAEDRAGVGCMRRADLRPRTGPEQSSATARVSMSLPLAVFLFLHVMGAIAVFGPTFVFPIIASQAQKAPQHGQVRGAVRREYIERRVVLPGAVVQGITGVALILILGADLTQLGLPLARRRDRPVPDRDRLRALRPGEERREDGRADGAACRPAAARRRRPGRRPRSPRPARRSSRAAMFLDGPDRPDRDPDGDQADASERGGRPARRPAAGYHDGETMTRRSRSPTDAARRRPRPRPDRAASAARPTSTATAWSSTTRRRSAATSSATSPGPRRSPRTRRRSRPPSGSSARPPASSAPTARASTSCTWPAPAARSTASPSRRSTSGPRPSTWPGRSTRRPTAADVGAVILELARSEQTYTFQRPIDYATAVLAGADRGGLAGPGLPPGRPLPVQREEVRGRPRGDDRGDPARLPAGDRRRLPEHRHRQLDARRPGAARPVDEQQRENYVRAAELTALIRSLETDGVTVSVGGEIGEVGKENSNEEELVAYLDGYRRELERRAPGRASGSARSASRPGTSHGGVPLPDGSVAAVKLDFEVLAPARRGRPRRTASPGAVQHGASTLPDELFHRFPAVETAEIHLATGLPERALRASGLPGRAPPRDRGVVLRQRRSTSASPTRPTSSSSTRRARRRSGRSSASSGTCRRRTRSSRPSDARSRSCSPSSA